MFGWVFSIDPACMILVDELEMCRGLFAKRESKSSCGRGRSSPKPMWPENPSLADRLLGAMIATANIRLHAYAARS